MAAPSTHRNHDVPALTAAQRAELRADLELELRRFVPTKVPAGEAAGFAEALERLDPGPRRQALQILDALRRFDTGTFGRCLGCRAPIAYERLAAIPETTLCARCGASRV